MKLSVSPKVTSQQREKICLNKTSQSLCASVEKEGSLYSEQDPDLYQIIMDPEWEAQKSNGYTRSRNTAANESEARQ